MTHPTPAAPPTSDTPPLPQRTIVDFQTEQKHHRARTVAYRREDLAKTFRKAHGGMLLVACLAAALWLVGVLPLQAVWEALVLLPTGPAVIGGAILYAGILRLVHLHRHAGELRTVRGIEPPPPPCTFFGPDFYVGMGWTEAGAQPGEWITPDEEILDPYVSITGTGVYQNTLIQGAPGTGKTEGAIKKLLEQAMRKYPKPPLIPRTADGRWVLVPRWDSNEAEAIWTYVRTGQARIARLPFAWLRARVTAVVERRLGGRDVIEAVTDHLVLAAYGGCTSEAEAIARCADLQRKHETMRPAILVLNAKSEGKDDSLSEFVRRCAAADSPERLAQVNVVSPVYGTSLAAFDITREPSDIGDSIRRSIEVIDGQGDSYWAGRATAWLVHVLDVLKVLRPGRINWFEVLSLANDQAGYFTATVEDAQALESEQNARAKVGILVGKRVPHQSLRALEKFRGLDSKEWDSVISRISDFGRYLMTDKLARVMAPEVPTFGTWNDVVREGRIVVVDLPLARYNNVARAISILQLNAFLSAAHEHGADTVAGERRPTFVFVDEVHAFLSDEFRRALATGRAADCGAFLGLQTTAQLAEGGSAEVATYLTNCQNKISYREPDGAAARRLSESYGLRQITEVDYSLAEAAEGGPSAMPAAGAKMRTSASMRLVKRDVPRFKAEAIMALPTGRAIVTTTDGRRNFPPRCVVTPRPSDVPWLADLDPSPLPPYSPPIPLCPITDAHPDSALSRDRLCYLQDMADATREETLAVHPLRQDGALWGFLLWNHRFGFVIDRCELDADLRGTLSAALLKPERFKVDLNPPFVLVQGLRAAHDVERLLAEVAATDDTAGLPGVRIVQPFVLASGVTNWQAQADLDATTPPKGRKPVRPPATTPAAVQALWAKLPTTPDAYFNLSARAWQDVSGTMQALLDCYRDLRRAVQELDSASARTGDAFVTPWLGALTSNWRQRLDDLAADPAALAVEDEPATVLLPTQAAAGNDALPPLPPTVAPLATVAPVASADPDDEGVALAPAVPVAPRSLDAGFPTLRNAFDFAEILRALDPDGTHAPAAPTPAAPTPAAIPPQASPAPATLPPVSPAVSVPAASAASATGGALDLFAGAESPAPVAPTPTTPTDDPAPTPASALAGPQLGGESGLLDGAADQAGRVAVGGVLGSADADDGAAVPGAAPWAASGSGIPRDDKFDL